ncbi:MAG: 2Fe-2S iron-sulfur cluster-binding protein [Candidatus Poribacteria bacterium]|nr:2Fe-2S iron-sulfur cluster-binding protein [Candidatus Poribacteria bacterium]
MAPYLIQFILPDSTQKNIEASDEELILIAAYREGVDLPSTCLQGWCLSCAGCIEGKGEWDQSASRRYFPADHEAGFILLCTAKPSSNLRIKTHQRNAMREYRLAHKLPAPRGNW